VLRVAVLVDLLWSPAAGGQVKFWERAATGATQLDEPLDLTIHYSGEAEGEHRLASHVRYRLHRPVFSTRLLPFLKHIPDHTDLAPYHPRLARELVRCDVIHTTDAYFCFARTGLHVARRYGIPLVNSLHTDTPRYTRLYTDETVRRLFGHGGLARWLVERLKVGVGAARRKQAQLLRYQSACAFAIAPRAEDLELARRVLPAERVVPLERGLETGLFHPSRRDREWLEREYGIGQGTPVVLMVGRVNLAKRVMIVAQAVASLASAGLDICLFCAGQGEDRQAIANLLGRHARCPGIVTGESLARLFASADLLAHPSDYMETFGNVVVEAMAAGLPVVVASDSTVTRHIESGISGVVADPNPAEWARAIASLLEEPQRRATMGRAARARVVSRFKTWDRVVAEHFFPVWRAAAAGASTLSRSVTSV
jgi:glycosyltransferase involved in cell wall biosynthesis